ncbi:MAG: hypothetical protein HRU40_15565 [Saprospiraceae bacterium]|nr:hypothetical protein [Saprospiraceae bacterium]
MEWKSAKEYHAQFLYTLHSFPSTIRFVRRNQLWDGFWTYGWVSKLLVLLAFIAGIKFVSLFFDWFNNVDTSNPLVMASALGSFFTEVAAKEFEFLLSGGMKYIMLILLEIVIFHMTRKSFRILSGQDSDSSLNAFIKAQIRMLTVALRSFILESIIVMIIKVSTGILSFLNPVAFVVIVLVKAFFVGFTVVDNYYEQFGFSIKESTKEAQKNLGITLAVGLTLQLFFLIPLAGTIVAPVLGAVAATIVLYELTGVSRPKQEINEKELV